MEIQVLDPAAITLFVDNLSAIKLVKNPVFHQCTKHFERHYHYSREKYDEGTIDVLHMNTSEMPVDILTKILGRTKFEICRTRLGVTPI